MKPKTKTIVFILLSFMLGIFCGWFLVDRMMNKRPFAKGRGHGEFIKEINERLQLSELQIAQVDSILESRKQKMEIYKKQALAMRDSARMEIRRVLNDEQSKLFDEFNKEKDREEAKKWEQESGKKK
jgi:hypothetical protein